MGAGVTAGRRVRIRSACTARNGLAQVGGCGDARAGGVTHLRRDLDRGRTPALATASRSRPPSATTTAAAGDRRLRPLLRRPHRAGLRDLLTALASGELAGAAAGTMTVRARAIAGDRRRGRTRPGVVLRAVHGGIRFRCGAGGRSSRAFADGSFTSRIEDHWSWYAALRRSLWPDPSTRPPR
jgi:hypothetical protein